MSRRRRERGPRDRCSLSASWTATACAGAWSGSPAALKLDAPDARHSRSRLCAEAAAAARNNIPEYHCAISRDLTHRLRQPQRVVEFATGEQP